MIGKIASALIGREIDKSDGEGGAKGLILGYIAAGVFKRVVPIALAGGIVYAAKRAWDRRQEGEAAPAL